MITMKTTNLVITSLILVILTMLATSTIITVAMTKYHLAWLYLHWPVYQVSILNYSHKAYSQVKENCGINYLITYYDKNNQAIQPAVVITAIIIIFIETNTHSL